MLQKLIRATQQNEPQGELLTSAAQREGSIKIALKTSGRTKPYF